MAETKNEVVVEVVGEKPAKKAPAKSTTAKKAPAKTAAAKKEAVTEVEIGRAHV